MTADNQGSFTPILPWNKKWDWMHKPSSSISIGVKKTDILPGVLLNRGKTLALNRVVAQNTDCFMKARILNIQRQKDATEPLRLGAGQHNIFSGQISILANED